MAKIDFGNALKKAGDTAKNVKEKAVSAAQAGTEKAQAGAKVLKNAADRKKAEKANKEADKKAAAEKAAIESIGIKAIAPRSAIKVFYFLMSADGEIATEEEEKLDQIGRELDPGFDGYKDGVIGECKKQLEKIIDTGDFYDTLQDGVETALTEEQISIIGYLTPKLLLWDLMTIAYCDKEYNETERRLLKYIVRKLNIPKDVFLDMESTLATVNDIEREIAWIKTTDRPYLTIEKQIKELEKRRNDILHAVKALIIL